MELCAFCNEPVVARELGVYRQVTGWTQVRANGGANSLCMTSAAHAWAHASCIQSEKLRRSGMATQKETLFT